MDLSKVLKSKQVQPIAEAYIRLRFDSRFEVYLKDIERATHRKIPEKQIQLIKESIRNNDFSKLTPKQSHAHRSKFNSRKADIIAEWEIENHEKWPTYTEPIYSRKGKVIRLTGQRYDAHHIVECSWGGDNEWYNMIPAKHPSEHQHDIHRRNGPADLIFNPRKPKHSQIKDSIRYGRERRRRVS